MNLNIILNLNLNLNLNINLKLNRNRNRNLNLNLNLNLIETAEFLEFVIPVRSPRGTIAFLVEGIVTRNLNQYFPYIKRMDLAKDEWSTVMLNFKSGIGTKLPETLCYVAFGYALKQSLAQGSIVQNPVGRVDGIVKVRSNDTKADARRLALLLFENRDMFHKSQLKYKSDLRKPEFYKDILNMKNKPRADKVAMIFDYYQEMI